MVRVEHVLDSWKAVRQDTANAVDDFPAAEFDFRPAPDTMTFGEAARHILDASDGFTGLLLAGDDDFTTPDFREKMKSHMRKLASNGAVPELAAALRESVEQRTAALAAQPAAFWDHYITRFDGQRVTRLEMVADDQGARTDAPGRTCSVPEDEGIVPATTRRRLAKQAGK